MRPLVSRFTLYARTHAPSTADFGSALFTRTLPSNETTLRVADQRYGVIDLLNMGAHLPCPAVRVCLLGCVGVHVVDALAALSRNAGCSLPPAAPCRRAAHRG